MEDAERIGMTSVCKVITTGNNFLGVSVGRSSDEFLTAFEEADIVIAKGQANFESLEGSKIAGDKTFFVLRAKCPMVSELLDVSLGSIVLKRNIPAV